MHNTLRSTVILGSSSAVALAVGLVSFKLWAVLLGPSGVGLIAMLQSLLSIAVLLAGMGLGTGLVRAGATALSTGDRLTMVALWRSARILTWLFAVASTAALVLLRAPVAALALGDSRRSFLVALVAPAILPSLAAALHTSRLAAHQRVEALAKSSVAGSLLSGTLGVLCIWRWREDGIAPAILLGALVTWAAAYCFSRATDDRLETPVHLVRTSGRVLLKFGVPYMASALAGAGIQLMLPFLAFHYLGTEGAGYYKASTMIATGYLWFLTTAMAQDYYPRVSAAQHDSTRLVALVNEQNQLVMTAAIPVVLGMTLFASQVVPLVYSAAFLPAVEVLNWQLAGDILKFSSWTMAYVILARCGSFVFFWTELTGGAVSLLASWLGLRWFGLAGLGIGFLVTYLFYYPLVFLILKRAIGFRWSRRNTLLIGLASSGLLCLQALRTFGLNEVRLPLVIALFCISSVYSLHRLRSEYQNLRGTKPRLGADATK